MCAIQVAFVNLKSIFCVFLVDYYFPFNIRKYSFGKYAAMALNLNEVKIPLKYYFIFSSSDVFSFFFLLVKIFVAVSLLTLLTDLPP